MRRLLTLLTMMLVAIPAASAQVVGQNTQPGGGSGAFPLAVSTKLVIEGVNVKDKQGKPVKGLTAKDFTVTEDGVPQQISFCEYQELATAGEVSTARKAPEK